MGVNRLSMVKREVEMLKLTLLTLSLVIMLVLAFLPGLAFQFNVQAGGGAVHLSGRTVGGVCLVGFGIAR